MVLRRIHAGECGATSLHGEVPRWTGRYAEVLRSLRGVDRRRNP